MPGPLAGLKDSDQTMRVPNIDRCRYETIILDSIREKGFSNYVSTSCRIMILFEFYKTNKT